MTTRPTILSDNGGTWHVIYEVVCGCVLRIVIPLVALVFLTGRVICRLRTVGRRVRIKKSRVQRQRPIKQVKGSNWRRSLTITLGTVVGLFVACQLPDLALRVALIVSDVVPDARIDISILRQAQYVTSMLLIFNAAVNFFIYCIVGRNFRCTLVGLFSCRRNSTTTISSQVNREAGKPELQGPAEDSPAK